MVFLEQITDRDSKRVGELFQGGEAHIGIGFPEELLDIIEGDSGESRARVRGAGRVHHR